MGPRTSQHVYSIQNSFGRVTNCCQRVGGIGHASAVDSYINKYASVLVLEFLKNNTWEIASQSYFHYVFGPNSNVPQENRDPNGPGFILDNVEHNDFLCRKLNINLNYFHSFLILIRITLILYQ